MQKSIEYLTAAAVTPKIHQEAILSQQMERKTLELLPLSILETIQNEPTAAETIHSVPLFPFSSVRKQSVSQITKAIFQRC